MLRWTHHTVVPDLSIAKECCCPHIYLSWAYLNVSDCVTHIWPIPMVCNNIPCDPPRMYVCTYVLCENRSSIQSLALLCSAINQQEVLAFKISMQNSLKSAQVWAHYDAFSEHSWVWKFSAHCIWWPFKVGCSCMTISEPWVQINGQLQSCSTQLSTKVWVKLLLLFENTPKLNSRPSNFKTPPHTLTPSSVHTQNSQRSTMDLLWHALNSMLQV